jgi:hypothetical protein
MEITMTSSDDLKRKILSNPEAKSEYDALLRAELERLKVELETLLDEPARSPKVATWVDKILSIKTQLSNKY